MEKNKNKVLAILGSTGSVGTQALDVARARGYKVDLISANKNVQLAERQAREFLPRAVVMTDKTAARELELLLRDTDINVYSGEDALLSSIGESSADVVVNSIIGEAGLTPTIATLDAGKRLALANKESLVIAGKIVMERALARGCEIIPVDSEHSAIFQSMKSGKDSEVKSLILTASGGPFFGKTRSELESVTLAMTLAHPTWKMGKKITVDSATLMNKGFEVVEAAHLFGIPSERIKVVVHRESILHSAVEYIDNSIIGEMSVPDMRMCVQYAVDYPDRCISHTEPLDLAKIGRLTFSDVDTEAFPLLPLAARAMAEGGGMCAVMNAADEVAVGAFLEERLSFVGISEAVIHTYEKMSAAKSAKALDEIIMADREARRIATEYIKEKKL